MAEAKTPARSKRSGSARGGATGNGFNRCGKGLAVTNAEPNVLDGLVRRPLRQEQVATLSHVVRSVCKRLSSGQALLLGEARAQVQSRGLQELGGTKDQQLWGSAALTLCFDALAEAMVINVWIKQTSGFGGLNAGGGGSVDWCSPLPGCAGTAEAMFVLAKCAVSDKRR